jgi:hypothetical protein
MKPDDFENQLQRQPLRAAPAEWRAEILQAARSASPPRAPRLAPPASPWWREWLWPSPQAWAGLAAAWIAIAVLKGVSSRNEMAKQTPKPSPETETILAAQRRELARLLDNLNEPTPKPRTGPPGPRSENVSPPRV